MQPDAVQARDVPWTMTLSKGGRLDVDLTRAIEGDEWPGLRDAILEALPTLVHVVFLFPPDFDAGSHAEALADMLSVLGAQGVTTERRHHGDRPKHLPHREPCAGCGSTRVVLQGRLFDGRPIRELVCLSCGRTQRFEMPGGAP
jgi:hypothetical protein